MSDTAGIQEQVPDVAAGRSAGKDVGPIIIQARIRFVVDADVVDEPVEYMKRCVEGMVAETDLLAASMDQVKVCSLSAAEVE